ncbi:hypothetical protein DPMN_105842 [Dreissena polymorpha]|uniref:Uncharacterized protein n=1 Tax=Dreissena polymorpha TaxID=45954 RepID=A0A9D4K3W7_DREPO|nr:hypothetical protein DPMN_105842 [Dreissena polymorpha]
MSTHACTGGQYGILEANHKHARMGGQYGILEANHEHARTTMGTHARLDSTVS